jgi:hypothetical protein
MYEKYANWMIEVELGAEILERNHFYLATRAGAEGTVNRRDNRNSFQFLKPK